MGSGFQPLVIRWSWHLGRVPQPIQMKLAATRFHGAGPATRILTLFGHIKFFILTILSLKCDWDDTRDA